MGFGGPISSARYMYMYALSNHTATGVEEEPKG